MTISDKDYADHLIKLYEGQTAHGRHHEVMRAQATNYVLVISAVLIGMASSGETFGSGLDVRDRAILGIVVVLVNAYGVLLSLTHYSRSKQSNEVGSAYRRALEPIHLAGGFTPTEVIRAEARNNMRKPFVGRFRLHIVWVLLHVMLALVGVALFVLV